MAATVCRSSATTIRAAPGVRVILDVRPLQDPERAPIAAAYLGGLLGAYNAAPLTGESFALLLRSDLDDPTVPYGRLDVVGRRLLPPTGWLRSVAQTVDPFLLRGASMGAAWRAERSGARGAVYHTVGAGTLPIGSSLPVVVSVLDLAPWEAPGTFAATPGTRFGQRLRGQLLRRAAAVIVGTEAVARDLRRLVHVRSERIRVVPLAPRSEFTMDRSGGLDDSGDIVHLGLPSRYLVYPGRYDARQDLGTLLRALADLTTAGRPTELSAAVPWPPRVLLVGASPDDRAALARSAVRYGVGSALAYAPALSPTRLAGLLRHARAALLPVRIESAGLSAIETIACGTPVIASAVGALPEIVGTAGLLVEPRDPPRLAAALRTIWLDDRLHGRLAAAARARATIEPRTWRDVADETREIYGQVGIARA